MLYSGVHPTTLPATFSEHPARPKQKSVGEKASERRRRRESVGSKKKERKVVTETQKNSPSARSTGGVNRSEFKTNQPVTVVHPARCGHLEVAATWLSTPSYKKEEKSVGEKAPDRKKAPERKRRKQEARKESRN